MTLSEISARLRAVRRTVNRLSYSLINHQREIRPLIAAELRQLADAVDLPPPVRPALSQAPLARDQGGCHVRP